MKVWKVALVALALLVAGCGGASGGTDGHLGGGAAGTARAASGLRTVVIDTSAGKKVEVWVEVADDEAERERGLMYRTALGEDRGMLFVYPREQVLTFWMKNTLIPLSIAYIDSEGRITDILDMKPLDDKPPLYVSSQPVRYALEVNQGFFDKKGVKVGDRVELPD